MTAPNRREVDNLAAQTPTWKRLSGVLVQTLGAFGPAARAVAAKLRADRSAPFVALAKSIEARILPEAPAGPPPEAARAQTFEERSLVCADLLMSGQWKTTTIRDLAELWKVDPAAISNYRRAGQVARSALVFGFEEKLEDTLAQFLRQQEEAETIARDLEARGEHSEAARYRTIGVAARRHYAETAGIIQQRVSVSLEADPRFQGMYQAIGAALEDFDRLRVAWLDEVAKLTGGPLPATALPSAREHVKAAVKRYEVEVGARAEAKRLAA